MTPFGWICLGWALFSSLTTLALLGVHIRERTGHAEAEELREKSAFERGMMMGRLKAVGEQREQTDAQS
jgi:hypothetical protein